MKLMGFERLNCFFLFGDIAFTSVVDFAKSIQIQALTISRDSSGKRLTCGNISKQFEIAVT